MTTIQTRAGERLDTLCYRHYGHLIGSVEAVLAVNIGLALIAMQENDGLPAGLNVVMPDIQASTSKRVVLW